LKVEEKKRMRIQRNKSTAIAFVLMLTIAAMFIAALPVAFGQLKIDMSATIIVLPSPVGLDQSVTILGMVYPTPPVYGDVYHNLNFTITKPDATTETIVHDSSEIAEYNFDYVCDQLGTWRVGLSWAGDETHGACSRSSTWTVQAEQVPPQGKIATYAGVATVPKTIGQGQYIYIVGFITPPRELSGAVYPNLTFTITDPDGATDTRVHYSNSEATYSFGYVCDQTGTWSVTLSYPGHVFQQGATSEPATWTVQTEPEPTYPSEPLPTGYWEYPISGENYEWYQIAGPWPTSNYDKSRSGSNWNPYTKAPNTPHVLWKLETWSGGIIGGETGYLSTYCPPERRGSFSAAAQGRFYYTTSEPYTTSEGLGATHPVLWCFDQYSGELIYRRDIPGTGSGGAPILEMIGFLKVDPKVAVEESPRGVFSIWLTSGSIWEIDAWDGVTKYYWPGRSGTYYDGAIYISNYNGTAAASQPGVMTKWDCRAKETVWTARIPSVSHYWEDILVRVEGPSSGIPYGHRITTWNATTGDLIAEGPEYPFASSDTDICGYGKFFVHCGDRKVYALSLYTGKLVWESEPMDAPWGAFSSYGASCGAGLVFFDSHDGYLYAYDVETGNLKWRAYTEDTTETAFGTYGTWSQTIIADGKVYFACGEHSPPNPLPRGGKLRCVDLETGDELWNIGGFYAKAGVQNQGGVSSGILWYPSLIDGCIWFFGKGKTATTVSASPKVIANGASVLIEGTVTDQSSGAKDTPAISDEHMSAWMEYLYNSKQMPTAFKRKYN
jgi:outer membrane protein assembly factor BamB